VSVAIRIRAIAAGGDGVGTLADGRTVFVPRSAPGDLAELTEVRLARRFARARVARLLEAAAERVAPRCRHYEADDCGSCQLQHLGSQAQRAARRRLVGDALRRIGHQTVEDPPLEPSDTEWEYRTKVTLTARDHRIGYHRLGQPGRVFELQRCAIARPELNQLWAALRDHRRLLPSNLDQLVLRVDRAGARHALVRTLAGDAWTGAQGLGEALARQGLEAVLWWEPADGAPRTVYGAAEAYPVTVFEQVHPAMGDRVRAYAVGELGMVRGQHIWDLYAGIGETSRALAALGATVESVEADPRAVRVAEAQGPDAGVTRIAARVEAVIARLRAPDAILVNPPRSGLAQQVTSRLSGLPACRLVYISCDAATLARDLARLEREYRLCALRAFDLFPQTAHVETVARLERR
jgi:23S rRNA (uracil1939-C5)-methyltransferase